MWKTSRHILGLAKLVSNIQNYSPVGNLVVCVCLSVQLSVCSSLRPSPYLRNHQQEFLYYGHDDFYNRYCTNYCLHAIYVCSMQQYYYVCYAQYVAMYLYLLYDAILIVLKTFNSSINIVMLYMFFSTILYISVKVFDVTNEIIIS